MAWRLPIGESLTVDDPVAVLRSISSVFWGKMVTSPDVEQTGSAMATGRVACWHRLVSRRTTNDSCQDEPEQTNDTRTAVIRQACVQGIATRFWDDKISAIGICGIARSRF